jgi:hypothetical protein
MKKSANFFPLNHSARLKNAGHAHQPYARPAMGAAGWWFQSGKLMENTRRQITDKIVEETIVMQYRDTTSGFLVNEAHETDSTSTIAMTLLGLIWLVGVAFGAFVVSLLL